MGRDNKQERKKKKQEAGLLTSQRTRAKRSLEAVQGRGLEPEKSN